MLEALLNNNFDDYAAIRNDPDLAALRGPELEALLNRCVGWQWSGGITAGAPPAGGASDGLHGSGVSSPWQLW